MNRKQVLVIVFAVILSCIGLQGTPAKANNLDWAVSNDESPVEATIAIEAANKALTEAATLGPISAPFSGTSAKTEALIADGVSLKDPLTWEQIKALRPLGGNGTESVIGWDTRMRDYTSTFPLRATVLITNSTDGFFCTGFLVNKNTVITAGHCVHSGGSAGHWYTQAGYVVYPGRNSTTSPYGSCTVKSMHSVTGWTVSYNESFDYGALKLNCTVGNTVGWFGFFWTSASLANTPTISNGYPGDKSAGTQWVSADIVRYSGTEQVFYSNDSYGGQSGSPVWYDKGTGGSYAFAIHGYGLHGTGYHAAYNHGKRITSSAYNNFLYWRNLP